MYLFIIIRRNEKDLETNSKYDSCFIPEKLLSTEWKKRKRSKIVKELTRNRRVSDNSNPKIQLTSRRRDDTRTSLSLDPPFPLAQRSSISHNHPSSSSQSPLDRSKAFARFPPISSVRRSLFDYIPIIEPRDLDWPLLC